MGMGSTQVGAMVASVADFGSGSIPWWARVPKAAGRYPRKKKSRRGCGDGTKGRGQAPELAKEAMEQLDVH